MSDEHVYRALPPWKKFEREDGTVSNAAFKDSKGLSVDLQCFRSDDEVVDYMHNVTNLHGNVAKIPSLVCEESDIEIFNAPSNNEYHRLLLNKFRKNEKDLCLTDIQADDLADGIVDILH